MSGKRYFHIVKKLLLSGALAVALASCSGGGTDGSGLDRILNLNGMVVNDDLTGESGVELTLLDSENEPLASATSDEAGDFLLLSKNAPEQVSLKVLDPKTGLSSILQINGSQSLQDQSFKAVLLISEMKNEIAIIELIETSNKDEASAKLENLDPITNGPIESSNSSGIIKPSFQEPKQHPDPKQNKPKNPVDDPSDPIGNDSPEDIAPISESPWASPLPDDFFEQSKQKANHQDDIPEVDIDPNCSIESPRVPVVNTQNEDSSELDNQAGIIEEQNDPIESEDSQTKTTVDSSAGKKASF